MNWLNLNQKDFLKFMLENKKLHVENIIDKKLSQRGRNDDNGIKFGYDSRSVADINNFMVDDVKIILAEYRLALKKNGVTRKDL